jgi:NAD(P)-dependent dehydrogenase (short-subunit alcohol dehydrogenase family)
MSVEAAPVWFITGCSSGFGRELTKLVLARGWRAVVTARDPRQLEALAAGHDGQALLLALDVTDPTAVDAAVASATATFGRIDVLVNNAGIGYFAAIEEGEDAAIRRMFEINVFGLTRLTQAVLPQLRRQRSGHIVNFSSIGGLCAYPALGFYNATKFAVEGLSEALAKEVAPLGIKVLLVEPSGFRTDWAGRSAAESAREIADYAATAGATRREVRKSSGHQPGDPRLAALAIVEAVQSDHPPLRLLLGRDALLAARGKLDELRDEFAAWERVTLGADAPESARE